MTLRKKEHYLFSYSIKLFMLGIGSSPPKSNAIKYDLPIISVIVINHSIVLVIPGVRGSVF